MTSISRERSLTDIQKGIVEQNKQLVSIQLEKRLKVESKLRRKHNAVISEISKDAIADILKLDPMSTEYKKRRSLALCFCCYEFATKLVSYDYNGARVIERYCSSCFKIHVK
jgi:hypothetical protein